MNDVSEIRSTFITRATVLHLRQGSSFRRHTAHRMAAGLGSTSKQADLRQLCASETPNPRVPVSCTFGRET